MTATEDVIQIACQADARFAPDCAVMLHSLFSSNPDEIFDIHFVHDGKLTAAEMQGLGDIVLGFRSRWVPLLMPAAELTGFPWVPHYGGHAAWYRLFLHRLLPDIPKILYLDADLLVLDRIRPLWETNLDGKCVAAVTNPLFTHMVERIQGTLSLPNGGSYFNSGVLLLDLDELRGSGNGDKVIALVCAGQIPLPWPDQDALNAVLWPHRLHLAPRWNATNAIWELPWRYLPWTQDEMEEARDRPAIVHFVGPYKPLHYRNRHRYRARYLEHLRQTRWKDREVTGRSLRHMLLRPLPLLWQLKIEDGSIDAGTLMRHLFPAESVIGGLLRDVYRWFTPRKQRSQLRLLLEALAFHKKDLFFIQVGSNDANHNDPLRPFIFSMRWRGIMIEPVPYVFERLKRNYQGVDGLIFENVAIATEDGSADFYCLEKSDDRLPEWYDQLGSFSLPNIRKHARAIPDLEQRIVTLRVPCLTFESTCRKYGIGHIDLVHIDAEGFDFEVIKLIDFVTHTPTALLYEHKHLSPEDRSACQGLLTTRGYDCMEIGFDTFCVDKRAVTMPLTRLGRAWRMAKRSQSL